MGCHVLLQGIFLIQGSNPHLLHLLQVLYCCTIWEDPLFTFVDRYFLPVCVCVCVCVRLQGVWQHPWLSPMRHEQRPPNSWDNQTVCQMSPGHRILPSSEPLPYTLLPFTPSDPGHQVDCAGLPRQAGGAGGGQRHRKGRKQRMPASFLGSLYPQSIFKLIVRTKTNKIPAKWLFRWGCQIY